MAKLRYAEAINQALREEMERDPTVWLFGEDIGVYGGVFKATRDLMAGFGEERVRDTPISEQTLTAMAVSAAMTEGEMRKLHELLWRLWDGRAEAHTDEARRELAILVLGAAIARVGGFCHLREVETVLRAGTDCFRDAAFDVDTVLEELVLYCGRIAAWLDLRICWWPMNEITLKSLEG